MIYSVKKNVLPVIILCILAFVFSSCACLRNSSCVSGGVCASKSFLVNSGFEEKESAGDTPVGWDKTVLPQYTEYVEFILDDTTAWRGHNSISIRISDDFPATDPIHFNWHTDCMTLQEDKVYELSCHVKGQNLKESAWVCVQCWDKSNNDMLYFATTQEEYTAKGTFGWKKVRALFSVPAGTSNITVRAGLSAPANRNGRVWFDEIQISEVKTRSMGVPEQPLH